MRCSRRTLRATSPMRCGHETHVELAVSADVAAWPVVIAERQPFARQHPARGGARPVFWLGLTGTEALAFSTTQTSRGSEADLARRCRRVPLQSHSCAHHLRSEA